MIKLCFLFPANQYKMEVLLLLDQISVIIANTGNYVLFRVVLSPLLKSPLGKHLLYQFPFFWLMMMVMIPFCRLKKDGNAYSSSANLLRLYVAEPYSRSCCCNLN